MRRSLALILAGSAATAVVFLIVATSPILPTEHTPEHMHTCAGFVVMHHHEASRPQHSIDYPWYRLEWTTEDVRELLQGTPQPNVSGDVEAPFLAEIRAMSVAEAKAALNAAYAACMDHAWPGWPGQEEGEETP